jgi:hypothetical protein
MTEPKATIKQNVLNAQEVFLVDAGDIYTECHLNHSLS